MKKILALLLASVMALSLAACGGNTSDETTDTTGTTENNTTTEANPADAIPDTMTSEDGTYELAFVTDVGQLKDKSFNEGTLEWREALCQRERHVLQVLSARQRRPGYRR